MKNNKEQIPCPFCGCAGKVRVRISGDCVPECTNESCIASYMIGASFETIDEAIEAWNRRT